MIFIFLLVGICSKLLSVGELRSIINSDFVISSSVTLDGNRNDAFVKKDINSCQFKLNTSNVYSSGSCYIKLFDTNGIELGSKKIIISK